jgi:hypothetical protein
MIVYQSNRPALVGIKPGRFIWHGTASAHIDLLGVPWLMISEEPAGAPHLRRVRARM